MPFKKCPWWCDRLGHRKLVKEKMASSEAFESAQRSYLSRNAQRLRSDNDPLLERGELHRH